VHRFLRRYRNHAIATARGLLPPSSRDLKAAKVLPMQRSQSVEPGALLLVVVRREVARCE
jgi:hypothetical protein